MNIHTRNAWESVRYKYGKTHANDELAPLTTFTIQTVFGCRIQEIVVSFDDKYIARLRSPD